MMSTTIPYRPTGSYAAADYSAHFPGATEFLPDMQAVDGLNEANRLNQQFTMRNIVDATNQFRDQAPALYEAAKREQAQGFAGPATKRFAQLQASLTGQNVADRNAANSMRTVGPFMSTVDRNDLDLFKAYAPMRAENRLDRAETRKNAHEDFAQKQAEDVLAEQQFKNRLMAPRVQQETMRQSQRAHDDTYQKAWDAINSGALTDVGQLRAYSGLEPNDYAQLRNLMTFAQHRKGEVSDQAQGNAEGFNQEMTAARMAPYRKEVESKFTEAQKDAGPIPWYETDPRSTSTMGQFVNNMTGGLTGHYGQQHIDDLAQAQRERDAQLSFVQEHPESLSDQDSNPAVLRQVEAIRARASKMQGILPDKTGMYRGIPASPYRGIRPDAQDVHPDGYDPVFDGYWDSPASQPAPQPQARAQGRSAQIPAQGTPPSMWPIVPHRTTGDLYRVNPDGETEFYAANPNRPPARQPINYGNGISFNGGFSGDGMPSPEPDYAPGRVNFGANNWDPSL